MNFNDNECEKINEDNCYVIVHKLDQDRKYYE